MMRIQSYQLIFGAIIAGLLHSPVTPAKKKTDKPKVAPKSYEAMIKNHRIINGQFTLFQHKKKGSVLMSIDKKQLDKEFIYFSQTLNGVLEARHFRGAYRSTKIFTINKHHDQLEFVAQNNSFYYDPENALSRSKDANISPSVFAVAPIKATKKEGEKNLYLIDITDLLKSEALQQVKASPRRNAPKGMFKLGKMSKKKSKIVGLKNYPSNTDFIVDYVYHNAAPQNYGRPEVTDARNVTISLRHSFLEVPQNNYKPRFDDFRVGYFSHNINDMTSASFTPYRDLIRRWDLQKKNPKAKISDPVQPIVWWLENSTPVEYRKDVTDAVLAWNIAFEKAGFSNAIVVRQQPDDAKWDAGDIRYNVLRWTASPSPPFGGYGPSFSNPKTGQQIGADIMLEYVYMTNRIKYQNLINSTPTSTAVELEQGEHACHFGELMQADLQLGLATLSTRGASSKEKKRLFREGLKHLILHEVGHTLGLSHNMKASSMVSLEELHDLDLANKRGLVGSVMDYTPLNLAMPGEKQGKYYSDRPGSYDLWAIEFGYHPPLADKEAEKKRMQALLNRSSDPLLTFGNDADDMRSSRRGMDPRVNVGDLSSDTIAWAEQRFQLIDELSVDLLKETSSPDQSYQKLVNLYSIMLSFQSGAARVASRYIGGVYVERGTASQFNEKRRPFTPVDIRDQQRAMKLLKNRVFSPDAFAASEELYAHLQTQRRGFGFFASPEDPKIHARVLAIQKGILSHLLHPTVLTRMSDSQLYGNEYTAFQMLSELTSAIFKGDRMSSINGFRQNLQLYYTQQLHKMSTSSSFNSHSKAAALHNLKRIEKMTGSCFMGLCGGNKQSRAHRRHIRHVLKGR